jgi:hypothetical protein
MQPLRNRLKKLDYVDFVRLLIERCLLLDNFKNSSAGRQLMEIEGRKNNSILFINNYAPGIFENIINDVAQMLSPGAILFSIPTFSVSR